MTPLFHLYGIFFSFLFCSYYYVFLLCTVYTHKHTKTQFIINIFSLLFGVCIMHICVVYVYTWQCLCSIFFSIRFFFSPGFYLASLRCAFSFSVAKNTRTFTRGVRSYICNISIHSAIKYAVKWLLANWALSARWDCARPLHI